MVMRSSKGPAVSLSSRGLGLVYLISNFAQFHHPSCKSRWTFRHQLWVQENRFIRREIRYFKIIDNQVSYVGCDVGRRVYIFIKSVKLSKVLSVRARKKMLGDFASAKVHKVF